MKMTAVSIIVETIDKINTISIIVDKTKKRSIDKSLFLNYYRLIFITYS